MKSIFTSICFLIVSTIALPQPSWNQTVSKGNSTDRELCVKGNHGYEANTSGIICKALGDDRDTTFGIAGLVTTDFTLSDDVILSITLQPDGKIIATGASTDLSLRSAFAIARYNVDGSLDQSFGTDGKVTTYLGPGSDIPYAVILQPDRKILAAGTSFREGNPGGLDYDFAVVRYGPDGTLDTSFSHDGIQLISFSTSKDVARSMALQPDGKILLAGLGHESLYQYLSVVRLNSNGSIDSTFSSDGKIESYDGWSTANMIWVQPDDKILVSGTLQDANNVFHEFLARYNPDGSPDTSFSSDGIDTTAFRITAASFPDGGKIVSSGSLDNGNDEDMAIARFNPDGTLDGSFGANGISVIPIPGSNETIKYQLIQFDDKIILTGRSIVDTLSYVICAQYNPDGSLDTGFNQNGVMILNSDNSWSNYEMEDVRLQPNGKILAAGRSFNGTDWDFKLIRYLTSLELGTVEFAESKNSLWIYPNPITSGAMMEYTLKSRETINIQLSDLQGKTIKTFINNQNQEAGTHQQMIAFPDELAPGFYFITLSSVSGRVCIKIVK
jgi:uncharacterized delta-60 repeat protein